MPRPTINRRSALALACTAACLPLRPLAAQTTPAPKLPPQPTPAEAAFVGKLQATIPPRFSTLAAARRAGFFQYTPEDETGAISYVNMKVWNRMELELPNQLWYDVNGRLLGVDFTVFESVSPQPPPDLFGFAIERGRWVRRGAHVHYGFMGPDGSLKFCALTPQKFRDAGGATESVRVAREQAGPHRRGYGGCAARASEVRLPAPGDVGFGRLGSPEPTARERRQPERQALTKRRRTLAPFWEWAPAETGLRNPSQRLRIPARKCNVLYGVDPALAAVAEIVKAVDAVVVVQVFDPVVNLLG